MGRKRKYAHYLSYSESLVHRINTYRRAHTHREEDSSGRNKGTRDREKKFGEVAGKRICKKYKDIYV